ncbi:hypothetical protein HanIR_Chr11g0507721 [Helianthus annuus]|nr:hypothetical protein HanIR_Chr11g0507721 [Helianthus annuus]
MKLLHPNLFPPCLVLFGPKTPYSLLKKTKNHQSIRTNDTSADSKVCNLFLLYILLFCLFLFRYYFFLSSHMNVVGVFPI